MATEVAYQLMEAPEGRVDGSGQVRHDIIAVEREEGTSDPWLTVPDYHKDFLLLASEVEDALAQPTTGQKVTAYRNYLAANAETPAQPLPYPQRGGWSEAEIQAHSEAVAVYNAEKAIKDGEAASAAADVTAFISGQGWTYPIQFRLNI